MGVRAHGISLSEDADTALSALEGSRNPRCKSLAKRARSLRTTLLADALHGEVIKKALPRALGTKHGIENLYVEDLPDFWRLLYTIVRAGVERHIIVIEIVEHSRYDKWFPNKRK